MDPRPLIWRWALGVVVAIVALVSYGPARAYGTIPPSSTSGWSISCGLSDCTFVGTSKADLCGQVHTRVLTIGYTAAFNGTYCQLFTGGGSLDSNIGYSTATVDGCSANSTLSGSTCICAAGYKPGATGQTCVEIGSCATVAAGLGTSIVTLPSGSGAYTACVEGCVVQGSFSATGSGATYIAAPFTATGSTCQGTSNTGTDTGTTPEGLKPGNCPGQVNGVDVPGGVPCSSTAAPGPSQAASGPTGAPGGTSGSSTSTVNTTCTNGSCTTVTNVYGSGGALAGTSSKTQDQGAYCANEGRGSRMCEADEEEGAFGGSCSAGFTCDGDPAQCAIAKEQHRRNCELMDTPTALSAIGTAAATGENPADHPRNAPESIAISLSSSLSSVPIFGTAGQCPADVTFTHAGFSFALPFASLCPYLQLLGAALLAAAYMAAGFIVFGRN